MTRRLAGLALVLAIVLAVHAGTAESITAGGGIVLGLGFALVAAVIAGDLADRLGLPRLTGYLLLGLVCGPSMANLITESMARELRLLNGVAVTLIGLVAGLELNLAQLRPRMREIACIGGAAIAGVWIVIFAAGWIAWPLLPIAPDAAPALKAAILALFATLAASFSPTVTIAVLAEARARGPLSELLIALVVAADLVVIVLFTVCLQAARLAAGGDAAHDVSPAALLAWEVVGSLCAGAILGAAFAFYLAHVARELTLVLLGLCVMISQFAPPLHLDAVLTALAAGLVVENVAPPRGHALRDAVERGSLPVLIVFFAAAGASLEVQALAATGVLTVVLVLLRMGGLWAGARVGARYGGLAPERGRLVWMGLVSQAGVTLGLASIVAREFPGWGDTLHTLVLALTGLHVLVGPVLLRAAISRAGEIPGSARRNSAAVQAEAESA